MTASGDKLLGGPQAGLLLGDAGLVERLRRHPLARALRVDKLTLAALEATVRAAPNPTRDAVHADPEVLRARCAAVAETLRRSGIDVSVGPSAAVVGGGGAPGVDLESWVVSLPPHLAVPLRTGDPSVAGRVEGAGCCWTCGRCRPTRTSSSWPPCVRWRMTGPTSVVATAGHVDHGKSSLVRALTGRDPDRYEEEKRRGLTIDLGYAWTDVPGAGTVAFVDVPGHERFVPTMLAGVGPVPVVLFVVAADGGWMPQSAEHLAALDALDVRHGLLVVTRADLTDPGPARDAALAELRRTSLGDVPAVACSAVTGEGLDDVRSTLAQVLGNVPVPDPLRPCGSGSTAASPSRAPGRW